MKKVLMAVAIVCAAAFAQASTIKWKCANGIADGTEEGATSATMVYLINAATLSQTDIYDAVLGGATLDEAVAGKYLSSATPRDGVVAQKSFDSTLSGSTSLYMVCFDGDMNALYFSEQMKKTVADVGDTLFGFSANSSIEAAMADMSTFDTSVGGWVSTAAVPEPTSGLLMLLGMAGLALRRRRS